MGKKSIDAETINQIASAISRSRYSWRTPRGISQEAGLPLGQVETALEQGDFVRARSSNPRGEPLYTTREKYKKTTSIGKRLLSALTNKIVD